MQPQALIITGMHRSGTSIVASFLREAGVDIGSDLLPPWAYNPGGYFEDREFFDFEKNLIASLNPPDSPAWHAIGWYDGDLNLELAMKCAEEARAILKKRMSRGATLWGWKDPRTVMLLDFWDRILPDANYVFVYRAPWDVMESFIESEQRFFQSEPLLPLKIWKRYNEKILSFIEKAPSRCALISCSHVVERPGSLVPLLQRRFDISLKDNGGSRHLTGSGVLREKGLSDPFVRLIARLDPQCLALLMKLEERADLKSGRDYSRLAEDRADTLELTLSLCEETCTLRANLKRDRWLLDHEIYEEIARYRTYLAHLRQSKFWKLRALWFRLRRAIGLKTEIGDLE